MRKKTALKKIVANMTMGNDGKSLAQHAGSNNFQKDL